MAREAVEWFAEKMEEKLAENESKGGWEDERDGYFLRRIADERNELARELKKLNRKMQRGVPLTAEECAAIVREAADVANFAFMIAFNYSVERRPLTPSFLLARAEANLEELRETIVDSFGWDTTEDAETANHEARVRAVAARWKELEDSINAEHAIAETATKRARALEAENEALRAKLLAWVPVVRASLELRHVMDRMPYGHAPTGSDGLGRSIHEVLPAVDGVSYGPFRLTDQKEGTSE